MAAFSRMARPRNVALAAVLAANGVLAQQSCVNLQGVTDDGTELNFLQVSSGGTDTYTAGFVDDVTQATSLNIDPTTGRMLDYTNGGRIANIDAGFDFDYLFFDYQAEMDQFDQLAVSCTTETQTETDGDITILTCAAADNPAVNVFNYCDGVVALSNSVQPDFGCVGLTLVVQDAGQCPELPVTSTTTTESSTSTDDAGATSTTTDAGVTTTETSTTTDAGVTTTATETTTASSTTSSGSSTSTGNTSILADPNTLSSSTTATINGTVTVLPVPQSTTGALTTSTIFATQTVTLTQDGGAVSTSMSVYPLYTTVCPIGAPAPTGGYAAGGYGAGAGAGGYGGNAAGVGYGASPSAPVYNPAHLVALPATICASQLNAVASKYPAGAMNSYSNYGVTPVNPGPNTGAGGNTPVTGSGNSGYGAGNNAGNNGAGNGAGNNAGNNAYNAGNGAGNNAGAGNMGAGNMGAGNMAGNNAGAGGKGGNAIGAAANNGSAAMGGAAASGTGAYKANPTAPMQYEGSASSIKMALGGVFAAAIALVCLI